MGRPRISAQEGGGMYGEEHGPGSLSSVKRGAVEYHYGELSAMTGWADISLGCIRYILTGERMIQF